MKKHTLFLLAAHCCINFRKNGEGEEEEEQAEADAMTVEGTVTRQRIDAAE